MQKIIVGVALLIAVFIPLVLSSLGLDFFKVNFNDAGGGAALLITFFAGIFISLGIDELLDEKFNC